MSMPLFIALALIAGLAFFALNLTLRSRAFFNSLRAAYRMLFAEEGTFQERLEDTAEAYAGSPEVMIILDFIRAESGRPLTMPQR